MRTPQSVMTVHEFVERKFKPEHVAMKETGGKVHYGTLIPIVLDGIPEIKTRSRKKPKPGDPPALEGKRSGGMGSLRLRDVSTGRWPAAGFLGGPDRRIKHAVRKAH